MTKVKPLIIILVVIAAGVLLATIIKQLNEPGPPNPEKAPLANPAKPENVVVNKPEVTKPEVEKPEVAEPEVAKPEVAEPEVAKPEVAEPKVAKPEVAEPEKGVEKMPEPKLVEQQVGEPDKGTPAVWDMDVAAAVQSGDPARIAKVMEWALGLEGVAQENALLKIAEQLAINDPESAFRLLAGMPSGAARANALRVAVSKIFQTNPDKAIRYAMDLDAEQDGEARSYLIKSLALALFPGQLEPAMQLVLQLPPGDEQNTLMNVMGAQMGAQGIDQVEAWLNTFPVEEMRELGLFSAAKALAGNDLKSAEEWIATLPEGPERDSAMAGMAATLAASDLEQAKTMILGMDEGFGKENGMMEVASRLTLDDADTAEQWIKALPAGRSRDRAYQGHITGRCQLDLEFKPDQIGQIQDPDIRHDLEIDVAGYLMSSQPSEESAEWVRNSSLSEEEKAQWLKNAGL